MSSPYAISQEKLDELRKMAAEVADQKQRHDEAQARVAAGFRFVLEQLREGVVHAIGLKRAREISEEVFHPDHESFAIKDGT